MFISFFVYFLFLSLSLRRSLSLSFTLSPLFLPVRATDISNAIFICHIVEIILLLVLLLLFTPNYDKYDSEYKITFLCPPVFGR